MLKFTKPVIIKKEKEEEPVTSKQMHTSADVGGTEPVVLEQEQPPVILQQESGSSSGGTIAAIVIGVIIVCKLVYNRFVLKSSNWFGLLGVPLFDKMWLEGLNPIMIPIWILSFVYNAIVTLFAVSIKDNSSKWNIFLIDKELVRQTEELFKTAATQLNGGSSIIDEEVSSILTSLSQL